MLSPSAKIQLWKTLFKPDPEEDPKSLYVLLDGATVRQLPDYLEDEEADHVPLLPLTSNEPEEVTRAAYLARVLPDSTLSDWLAGDGWGKNWGIFLCCPQGTDMDALLGHLRDLAQVRLPDGRIVYFRFYDPRVWRPFSTTCDSAQLKHLFPLPITYACESEDGTAVLLDRIKNGMVDRRSILLDEFTSDQPLPGVTQPA
ncbi:DUF4123 domain-containing protein [Prosthecobacter sp. SYSU 5D2]|uniref:DUF4123 domain-containing protein n=1 Tax=Prosthecobacter sp. SYSU 5D2 TaxID=3134134 RepID=UPI0031FEF6B9